MVLLKCSGCGEVVADASLPVEGTILDKICDGDELKVNKCDFKEVETSDDDDTVIELESTFSCDSKEIHARCGKSFAECECSFVRTFISNYHGRLVRYTCTCHPLSEDCECWHDQVYRCDEFD